MRERNISVWLPVALPLLGTCLHMCPDWESNCDPLVRRPALNLLSHTSQGPDEYFSFLSFFLSF